MRSSASAGAVPPRLKWEPLQDLLLQLLRGGRSPSSKSSLAQGIDARLGREYGSRPDPPRPRSCHPPNTGNGRLDPIATRDCRSLEHLAGERAPTNGYLGVLFALVVGSGVALLGLSQLRLRGRAHVSVSPDEAGALDA